MIAKNGREIRVGDLVTGTQKNGNIVTGIVIASNRVPAEMKDDIVVTPEHDELAIMRLPLNRNTTVLSSLETLKTEDVVHGPLEDDVVHTATLQQPQQPVAPQQQPVDPEPSSSPLESPS